MDMDFIEIDQNSRIPKYQQIVDLIINGISSGKLKMDQKLPSINMFSEEFYLSRDTVERAYDILRKRKIITSVRGKGFYIARTKLISRVNILFLINKLSSYKLLTYNHFIKSVGANCYTNLEVYHCDEILFINLLEKYKSTCDYFVIMPHFKTESLQHISVTEKVQVAMREIPDEKIIILDNSKPTEDNNNISQIYQDFENDIYYALEKGLSKIITYDKLILIYPSKGVYPYPKRILHGFRKFCLKHKVNFEIIDEVYDDIILKRGDLFITIEEDDLVNLVKQIRENEFKIGEEIGVISYNDTPLKELLGITVISTDFKTMGEKVAETILNKSKEKFKVPFNFINRESL